jgi:hypothetical protein
MAVAVVQLRCVLHLQFFQQRFGIGMRFQEARVDRELLAFAFRIAIFAGRDKGANRS